MKNTLGNFWEVLAWAMISFIVGVIDLIDVTIRGFQEPIPLPVRKSRREILDSIKQVNADK